MAGIGDRLKLPARNQVLPEAILLGPQSAQSGRSPSRLHSMTAIQARIAEFRTAAAARVGLSVERGLPPDYIQ